MARSPFRSICSPPRYRSLLVPALLIALVLFGASFRKGLADSGGFPTRTPTSTPIPPTLTPTSTSTATLEPTPILPTLTETPIGVQQEASPLPPPAQGAVTQPVPTPEEGAGGGALACLPIAIIFILGVVIAATWFLTRGAREPTITY